MKVRYRGLAKNTAQLHYAVRAGQFVDGAQTFDRELGMSAPGAWEMGAKRAQNATRAFSRHCGHVSTPNHGQRSFVQTFPRGRAVRDRAG